MVDPEPILGTLGTRLGLTLDGTPVHSRVLCKLTFTCSLTPRELLAQPIHHQYVFGRKLENQEKSNKHVMEEQVLDYGLDTKMVIGKIL